MKITSKILAEMLRCICRSIRGTGKKLVFTQLSCFSCRENRAVNGPRMFDQTRFFKLEAES